MFFFVVVVVVDEAARSYTDSGSPVLRPDDPVGIDNADIHQHEAERILVTFFRNIGVELVYDRISTDIFTGHEYRP